MRSFVISNYSFKNIILPEILTGKERFNSFKKQYALNEVSALSEEEINNIKILFSKHKIILYSRFSLKCRFTYTLKATHIKNPDTPIYK